MDTKPPRGTRDFFPDDMRLRTWLFGHFREVARQYGFEEYDAPVVETEDLYIRKAGEEITGQLYNFADKKGRRLALRPEMTPSLARMILAKGGALKLPVKWFSIPQCWRYERMTRGRKREHYQWNMDVFGVPGVAAEVELLAAIVTFLTRLGLSSADVGIKISSRKVLQGVLVDRLGVPEDKFAPVCVLVDKLEKLPREAIEKDLAELGLDGSLVDRIIETLSIRDLDALTEALGPEHEAVTDLMTLFTLAEAYGIADWLVLDASVVRGLAYYTGTVFEAFDRGATLRAICGGGRYDRLLSTFGGKDVPACGFGFGDVVIAELLKDKGLVPELTSTCDDIVFAFSEDLRGAAQQVAMKLRSAGRSVDLVLQKKKMKWAYTHADARGARRLVLIAPSEWEQGLVRIKDLATGGQADVAFDTL
ncbi:MAG: histidine--tRNA ligase [Proteobacteria bacterium]|nr:histidine--tRNA ligase [Pseudomonadota bacterium]